MALKYTPVGPESELSANTHEPQTPASPPQRGLAEKKQRRAAAGPPGSGCLGNLGQTCRSPRWLRGHSGETLKRSISHFTVGSSLLPGRSMRWGSQGAPLNTQELLIQRAEEAKQLPFDLLSSSQRNARRPTLCGAAAALQPLGASKGVPGCLSLGDTRRTSPCRARD